MATDLCFGHNQPLLYILNIPKTECRIVWPQIVWPGHFGHGHFGQNFCLGWTVWPNPGILYFNNELLNYQYLFGKQSIIEKLHDMTKEITNDLHGIYFILIIIFMSSK